MHGNDRKTENPYWRQSRTEDRQTDTQEKERLRKLVQLSSVINSSLEILQVLDSSMRFVEELVDAEASSIFELDRERDELFFRLVRGDPSEKAKEVRIKMGEGVAGWVALHGEPLLVPDASREKRFSPRTDRHTGFNTRSLIGVPIRSRGRVLGVLEVLNKRGPEPFTERDLELLQLVTNQIGTALENARLYGKLREKAELTEAELTETQSRLLRAERMAALGQLSQGVAHEVRNPVMSIGGFARRLLKALAPDDPGRKYAEVILQETARLEKMVSDVDQYTKMPEPVLKEWKLSDLVDAAVRLWEEDLARDDIRIEIELPPDDPSISADRDLMIRALFHLMRNASDAMPDGGIISISAGWEGNLLGIAIRDTGSGIAAEDLPRVFDPFFTSKTQGSGLGLTTVNRIVNDHGGEVKVSSRHGEGTEVRLFLDPRPWRVSTENSK